MTETEGTNPIEAVRTRLDGGRLWQKGGLGEVDRDNSPVCIVGASHVVKRGLGLSPYCQAPWGEAIEKVVVEQYRDRLDPSHLREGFTAVPDFNDHPDTTWADVDLVLDKAARAWDEQVQS